MNNVIDFVTDDGVTVKIEPLSPRRQGAQNVGKKSSSTTGEKRLDDVLRNVGKIAEAVSGQIRGLAGTPAAPTTAEVEFGLSVSAEADAVIIKGNGEVTFKVKLTWSGQE